MRPLHRAWNTIAPRQLFFVDGYGAGLSALCLGVVLPAFEGIVGLPARALHMLAWAAGGLAVCSLTCGWRNSGHWRPWLKGIAAANLLYGGLTAVLLLAHGRTLTAWGGAYFGLELAVMTLLARWEFRTAARSTGPLV